MELCDISDVQEEVYGRWKQILASGEATLPVLSRPSDLTNVTLPPDLLRPLRLTHISLIISSTHISTLARECLPFTHLINVGGQFADIQR